MSITEAEAAAFDAGGWLREQMRRTPSWAISIAFHALLLASFTLIAFQDEIKQAAGGFVSIIVPPKRREKIPIPPAGVRAPYDSSMPSVGETPADVPFPLLAMTNFEKGPPETDNGKPDGGGIDFGGGRTDAAAWAELPGSGLVGRALAGPAGTTSSLGVGDGAGTAGRFGPRGPGGNKNRWPGGLGGPSGVTEDAVKAGLRWLARHQAADGSWRATSFDAGCAPGAPCGGAGYAQYDAGLTGLSLLAFLGAGYTHLSRERYEDPHTHQVVDWGKVVRRGLDALIAMQDAEGCVGPRTGEFMYNHAIGALALAEAYGLTNAGKYRGPAQRAVDFLIQAQNPYRGWRYSVKPGDSDTSVTGWAVMALKSAEISGLAVARSSYDGARAWVDAATGEDGIVGYTGKGKVDVVVRGKNEQWRAHPAMTAVGILCKVFIEKDAADRALSRQGAHLVADLPRWQAGGAGERPIDFYYWYYGSLALYQLDAPDGRMWTSWNEALKTALLPHQELRRSGCTDGSWEPAVDRWGFAGGRVYATAINTLTLEVYYRYERVFGGGSRR